jgi:hypothetical protein
VGTEQSFGGVAVKMFVRVAEARASSQPKPKSAHLKRADGLATRLDWEYVQSRDEGVPPAVGRAFMRDIYGASRLR